MADKELRKKIKELLGSLGKVSFKENKSYDAVWLKRKKNSDLILCIFIGKKKTKVCLPWSTLPLNIDNKLPVIIEKFLVYKSAESISKNIHKLEKQLKEENLI